MTQMYLFRGLQQLTCAGQCFVVTSVVVSSFALWSEESIHNYIR